MKSLITFCTVHLAAAMAGLMLITDVASADILYVNISATGSNDGSSWTNAYQELQAAINIASPIDEIWVAAGIYLPTETHGDTSARNKTFYINKGMRIYGGFEGLPGSENNFLSRDVVAHPTILSGDIGQAGELVDNVFHVMWLDHVGFGLLLDGFTIKLGYGVDGTSGTSGAGIYNDGSVSGTSSPTISHCIFDHNTSFETGGAFMNIGSGGEAHPNFMYCVFTNNSGSGGGALTNIANPAGAASPLIFNCKFQGNSGPTAGGGAIQNIALSAGSASPQLYNCLFSGNYSPTSGAYHSFANDHGIINPLLVNCTFAGNFGGAFSTSAFGESMATPTIKNSIFWGNSGGGGIFENGATTTVTYSLIPFGLFPGEGNIGEDPLFVNLTDVNTAPTTLGDMHPIAGSPAINAGNNEALHVKNITKDLDGKARIQAENGGEGIVDMGAYEFHGEIVRTKEISILDKWTISPNPSSGDVTITYESHAAGWLRIFTEQGKIVLQKCFLDEGSTNDPVKINGLASGIYFVQIILDGQGSIRKLVIE
ncbi:MAG: T9SS type A sorting domain-containing protein [Saprospiraceae bacterium]